MDQIDKIKAKSWESVFIGFIAANMGFANQTNVVNSGKDIYQSLGRMTYKDFRNIKKILKDK